MTVTYQLYSSTLTASSVSQQTITILKKGRIIGVSAALAAIGAGSAGLTFVGLDHNTNGSATTGVNAPQKEAVIARFALATPASTYVGVNQSIPALNKPVNVGDVINLNSSVASGTAPTTGIGYFEVYVEE